MAVLPGETIKESLKVKGMTQAELALRMGRPKKTINEIIKGKAAITLDTAIQLEKALDAPASFWNNLERNYRENLARIRENELLGKQAYLVKDFPYKELSDYGFVKKTHDSIAQVGELLRFFGVVNLSSVYDFAPVAFKKAAGKRASNNACLSWLRIGEILASKIKTKPFNKSRFSELMHNIRQYTCQSPRVFEKKLKDDCAECGVAVVLFPHLKGTYAHGAIRWIDKNKVLLQLSLRYHYADMFWFSFFHEAAHLLLQGKHLNFVDTGDREDSKEKDADKVAADMLIQGSIYKRFVEEGDFSRISVERFAGRNGISPCIVIGRLAHERRVPYSHLNFMRPKINWSGEFLRQFQPV